jgi:hypothetical protein
MKNSLLIFIFLSTHIQAQLVSGEYSELRLAFDPESRILTGYYENYTGEDENTHNPKFSCIFYIEGKLIGGATKIKTYFPGDTTAIEGTFERADSNGVKISLPTEHGGCWNVQHFADGKVEFKLSQRMPWISIRYITKDKVHFYTGPPSSTQQSPYVVKGNVVFVQKIQNGWAYCTYYGIKETKGWIKVEDLNVLNPNSK